jgi:hypothetical protein
MFSWWTFSDVFEEDWMQSAPFHNGYGMMTMYGTRKPVWRAMQTLYAAGTGRYSAVTPQTHDRNSAISVLATTIATESHRTKLLPCSTTDSAMNLALYIASWHRVDAEHFSCDAKTKTCNVDPSGSYTDHSLCDALCSQNATKNAKMSTTLIITIKHASGSKIPSTAQACIMDDVHTNPQTAWEAMASPVYPNATEIQVMDKASELHKESLVINKVNETHSTLTVSLSEYSAVYVIL